MSLSELREFVMDREAWRAAIQGVAKPTRFLCPWDFPGKNTEMSCPALLLGIVLTQGSNPRF